MLGSREDPSSHSGSCVAPTFLAVYVGGTAAFTVSPKDTGRPPRFYRGHDTDLFLHARGTYM